MIAQSPRVTYIPEPFHADAPPRPWSLGFNQWFKYIPPENGNGSRDRVEGLLSPRILQLLTQVVSDTNSLKDVARLLRDNARLCIHQVTEATPLIKDPIALLSAEWLEEVWGSTNVVMIRHPAAFAGSLKVKDWTFPFEDLLHQPEAMSDLFEPYRQEIQHFAETDQHIVKQAALLWTLLYSVVRKYQERHPEWIFLRHEDVVRNPVSVFGRLYHNFGFEFTDEIRKHVEEKTDPSVLRNWKDRLTKEEITEVRECTEPVTSDFYADDEW
jgi:hypothetical protein